MSDIVSTSNKNQNATTSANHAHDFRSLWNYFFDFSNNDMDNIEPKIDISDNKTSVMVVAEIPGIKEDVTEIILNVKKIIAKLYNASQTRNLPLLSCIFFPILDKQKYQPMVFDKQDTFFLSFYLFH